MAYELASAYITVLPSFKSFSKGLDPLDKEFDRAGKTGGKKMADGAASSMKTNAKRIFAPLAAAAGAVGGVMLFKDLVNEASDAQQSIGATEALFGKYSDTVVKKSKEAAQEYGLSANEYRESSNLLAALFKNQGVEMDQLAGKTNEMVGLGADLAAMYGGTTADAVEAMTAAYKGEFNSLEKYGITLKASTVNAEAMAVANVKSAKEWNALTAEQQSAATQQATTNLLMKQSVDAQGQAGKEANTYAGQMQRLQASFANTKETLGAALLPVVTGFVTVLNQNVLPAVTGFIDGMKNGEGAGGRFADGFQRIKDVVVPIWDEITGGITAFTAAWQYNDGEVTSSGFPGMMERVGYWARQAFDYLKTNALPVLQNFIQGFKDGTGAGGSLRDTLTRLWEGWTIVVGVVRDTVIPILKDTWALFVNNIMPVLRQVVDFIVTRLWPDIVSAFHTHIIPAFQAVAAAISEFWVEVAEPVLKAFWNFVSDHIMPLLVDLYENGVKPTFEGIAEVIKWAWENIIRPVFTDLGDAPGKVKDRWDRAMTAIAAVWTRLKQIVATPIVAVINFVNEGLIGSLNKVLEWAGVNPIDPVSVPGSLSRAARGFNPQLGSARVGAGPQYALANGGILPGYSPGKDDHFFYGDKFNLALAGGEAIMRPEWTRAMGPHFIEEMNAAARSGGVTGVRRALSRRGQAYADGGIFEPQGGPQGDSMFPDWMMNLVSWPLNKAKEVLSNLINPMLNNLRSNPLFSMAEGFVGKTLGSMVKKVKELFGGGTGTDGRSGKGMPWEAIWTMVKAAAPEAILTSAFRPGARTAGYGNLSLHGLGRAIDIVPASMATYRKVMNLLPWTEAIFTPAGPFQKRNGQFYNETNPRTRADHWDHIHLAMAKGGLVPNLYDEGGAIMPGLSLVANQTGKPEMVLTNDQWTDIRESNDGNTIIINGIDTDNATEVADELLFALKRTGRGKYNRVR